MPSAEEVVVYNRKPSGTSDVSIITKTALNQLLADDPSLKCTRKPIPRGAHNIEILQEDLYDEDERLQYAGYPNQKVSLANIKLPGKVYMQRLTLPTAFSELYIVSVSESTLISET